MSQTKVEKNQKLLPTEVMDAARTLEEKNADGDGRLEERLPLIKCECGAEILLLPDLQTMNRAIKSHVAEHSKKRKNATTDINAYSGISKLLAQLTIRKINRP